MIFFFFAQILCPVQHAELRGKHPFGSRAATGPCSTGTCPYRELPRAITAGRKVPSCCRQDETHSVFVSIDCSLPGKTSAPHSTPRQPPQVRVHAHVYTHRLCCTHLDLVETTGGAECMLLMLFTSINTAPLGRRSRVPTCSTQWFWGPGACQKVFLIQAGPAAQQPPSSDWAWLWPGVVNSTPCWLLPAAICCPSLQPHSGDVRGVLGAALSTKMLWLLWKLSALRSAEVHSAEELLKW